tara:strand:+ start:3708 stop:4853 length:1146 start_codon:yes stop_codon:yes gene_type:complete
MAKISNTTSYPNATPAANDYVIGTDIDDNNATKTFKLQEIANLYAGSGSGTVTSVGLDGGTTGITITSDTANPITTTGTFTLGGTLAVANGGTGLTSLAEGSILIGDSSSSISSLAIGADTYVLTSNGTTASWAAASGGSGGPGTGTQYSIPLWSTTSTLGDSLLSQDSGSTLLSMSSGSLKVDTGGTTSKPAIAIRDTNTGIYSPASGRLGLITNGSEKVTIDDNIGIAIDPLTQFNNGLKFGGSGSTLDAYEEGTWTPVMFNSTSPSYTSSGTYIKIGKKVTVWFYINCTVGGSASVASYISGLPFNAVAVNGRRGTAVINQNTGNSSSVNYVGGKPGGSTTIILQKYTSTTSYVLANGEWPNAQGNFTVEGQFTYYSV